MTARMGKRLVVTGAYRRSHTFEPGQDEPGRGARGAAGARGRSRPWCRADGNFRPVSLSCSDSLIGGTTS